MDSDEQPTRVSGLNYASTSQLIRIQPGGGTGNVVVSGVLSAVLHTHEGKSRVWIEVGQDNVVELHLDPNTPVAYFHEQ